MLSPTSRYSKTPQFRYLSAGDTLRPFLVGELIATILDLRIARYHGLSRIPEGSILRSVCLGPVNTRMPTPMTFKCYLLSTTVYYGSEIPGTTPGSLYAPSRM